MEIRLMILSKTHTLLGISYSKGYETDTSTHLSKDFHELEIGFFFFTIGLIFF